MRQPSRKAYVVLLWCVAQLSWAAAPTCEELDATVRTLIQNIPTGRVHGPASGMSMYNGAQAQAFARLEKLGSAAVPFIVKYMDDRRQLRFDYIALENPRGAFEGMRQYGPDQVVDALSAALNQLTGTSFMFIYNGGDDASRAADVAGWRKYVHERFYAEHPDACKVEL